MIQTRIAVAVAALALLAAPAVAAAHGGGHHHKRHHHHKHHAKKAHAREVTGTATATVASFADGELTIALPSGKTFSASVTDKTVLKCRTAAPQATATAARHGDDHGDDDDAKGGRDHRGGRFDDGDDHDRGDDHGDGRCDATALVAGAKVTEAKLSLKGGDATWKKVELLK
jgi:hypothetical protein